MYTSSLLWKERTILVFSTFEGAMPLLRQKPWKIFFDQGLQKCRHTSMNIFFEMLLFLRNKIGPKKMEKKIGRSQEIFYLRKKMIHM